MTRTPWMACLLLVGLMSGCNDDTTPPETGNPDSGTPTDAGPPPADAGTPTDAGTGDSGTPYTGLSINEVVAAGDPDWFELYNASTRTIDLKGVTFSDDRTLPTKASFTASTLLAPGAFLRVDVGDTQTGFSLGSDEELSLYTPSGQQLDLVDWNDGDSPKNKSYGRIPNGTGAFKLLYTPTPGAANVDNDPTIACGNGKAEIDEECDGADLRSATCVSKGYASGTLACDTTCKLNYTACVAAASDVVLNELTSAGDDKIELFNRGTASADLTGWYVADSDYDPATGLPANKRFVLSGSLGVGEYRVLIKNTDHTFGLGKTGKLRFFNPSNTLVDTAEWTVSGSAEISFCRSPNGTGAFGTCASATFGAANP